jgi:hypothetical protein
MLNSNNSESFFFKEIGKYLSLRDRGEEAEEKREEGESCDGGR